jgi:hypothetical protein
VQANLGRYGVLRRRQEERGRDTGGGSCPAAQQTGAGVVRRGGTAQAGHQRGPEGADERVRVRVGGQRRRRRDARRLLPRLRRDGALPVGDSALRRQRSAQIPHHLLTHLPRFTISPIFYLKSDANFSIKSDLDDCDFNIFGSPVSPIFFF